MSLLRRALKRLPKTSSIAALLQAGSSSAMTAAAAVLSKTRPPIDRAE